MQNYMLVIEPDSFLRFHHCRDLHVKVIIEVRNKFVSITTDFVN